ncbi:uncharacterized protein LOC142590721, partial [Dermacentor variabilis]|uniref:uncharacterized protein LOC142590721 n=1 Tax=Dermacentor variabilis TaxID=34621 RepID=UPI003F5BAAFE
ISSAQSGKGNTNGRFKLTILHTNDIHSRILESDKRGLQCKKEKRKNGKCFGGIARIAYQLFGALVLGWECHAVARHGGALYNGSLTTEASFQDICASPASSNRGDCCLPPNEMLPVDQCLTGNGTVGDPCDEAAMAGAFAASMSPYAAALLWQGGCVTGRLSPDVHCASSASSAAPIASQLKANDPNEIFSGHGRTTGMMASRIFFSFHSWAALCEATQAASSSDSYGAPLTIAALRLASPQSTTNLKGHTRSSRNDEMEHSALLCKISDLENI